ncbi:copper resistance CopC family protein [Micromonospora arida]|uniref:copper resistance CopC family protein n=1 Tax=Micromonospora arida TaxID=2203715 RepID=UPI0033D09090
MSVPPSRPAAARLGAAVLAVLVAVLIPASPAWAHNSLRTATPARDATVPSAPTEVTLEFMQRLDPAFTTIVLTDAAKRKLPTGEPVVTGAKSTVQVTDTLPNGTYTVAYRVVSVDGHPVQGSYPFTVADPSSTVAPVVAVSASAPAPSAAAAKSGGGPSIGVLVAAAVLALLVLVTAGLLWRRAARRSDQP